MFGSHVFRRGNPIRKLDGLFSELFAVVACCLLALSGCGYVMNGSTNGQFPVSPGAVIFGAVPVGQVATSKVLLLNESSASIDISQLNIAGQNFFVNSPSSLPVTVSVGSTYSFVIGFKPDKESSYSGQFTVMSAAGKPIAQGSISGSGISGSDSSTPGLTVSTASLSFGDVTVNTPSTRPVTLSSTGTAPVTINSAALRGTGFTMSGSTFPITLNPNQSVTINVRFDPTAAGAVTGQLIIQSNSSTNSTAVVNLSGTGTAVSSPQLTISAASLTFGDVTVNTASIEPVTLSSTGTAPVTINSAALRGAGFTMSGSAFPITLNPNQSVTVNVRFDPAAAGAVMGQLTIQSNSSTNSTAVVNLSGTGTVVSSPQLSISAASLTFGDVTVNTTSIEPVTLSSTGTAPVTINSATLRGTGFTMSGATFPVTLNPGLAITLDVQFDPTGTGAITGQLAIQSNSSSNSAAVISLSGTGVLAEVDLSWEAPGTSLDAVVGYNIYRSPGNSSTYQLLNSSVDPQTTYVDSTVESGLTYDYIVTSVDSSGVESIPSNEYTATLP